MEAFFGILTCAVLVEAVVTYIKMIIVDKKVQWQVIFALVIGILVSIAYRLDLPAVLGLQANIPYIGMAITGLIISRGANYVFDIIDKINGVKDDRAA